MDVSKVALLYGGHAAAVFKPLGHPTQCAYVSSLQRRCQFISLHLFMQTVEIACLQPLGEFYVMRRLLFIIHTWFRGNDPTFVQDSPLLLLRLLLSFSSFLLLLLLLLFFLFLYSLRREEKKERKSVIGHRYPNAESQKDNCGL
jgi:hypothetical protein